MLYIKKFYRSISYAVRGLSYALRQEQNFRIQVIMAVIVIALMFYFRLQAWENIVISLMIIIVLVLELINTIFEKIVDILKPRIHPYAQVIKDMMAATVLVASFGALIIGIIVFTPYFAELFSW